MSELLKKRLEPPENGATLSLETECVRLGTVKLPGSIPTLASKSKRQLRNDLGNTKGQSFTGIFTYLRVRSVLVHCSVIARPLLAYCGNATLDPIRNSSLDASGQPVALHQGGNLKIARVKAGANSWQKRCWTRGYSPIMSPAPILSGTAGHQSLDF